MVDNHTLTNLRWYGYDCTHTGADEIIRCENFIRRKCEFNKKYADNKLSLVEKLTQIIIKTKLEKNIEIRFGKSLMYENIANYTEVDF